MIKAAFDPELLAAQKLLLEAKRSGRLGKYAESGVWDGFDPISWPGGEFSFDEEDDDNGT